MTINRDEHIPDIPSQASASAFFRTVFSGDAAKSLSLEQATQYVPWLKGYFEALKKFKEDHSVQYIQVLLEEIYRLGLTEPDRIDSLANALDNHDGVKLYLSYANEAAERSFSKKAKAMLALYSGKIVAKPELLERPESAIILSALSSINDFDLIHFDILMNYKEKHSERMIHVKHAYMNIKGLSIGEIDDKFISYSSSIQKLISLQIISQTPGSFGPHGDILVEPSPYTDTFHELYKEYCVLYEKPQKKPLE